MSDHSTYEQLKGFHKNLSINVVVMRTLNRGHVARMLDLSDEWVSQAGRHFDLAIIILAAVNVTAACVMIAIIVYDAYISARLHRSPLRRY